MSDVFLDLEQKNNKFKNNRSKKQLDLLDYLVPILLIVLAFTPIVSNIFAGIISGFLYIIFSCVYIFFIYYGIKNNFNCVYIKEKQAIEIVNNLYVQKLYGYFNIIEKITNIIIKDKINISRGYVDFVFLDGIKNQCVLKITPFYKNIKINKEIEVFSAYDKKEVRMFFKQLYENNIILFRSEREGIFKNIYNVIKQENKENFANWLKDYIYNYEKYNAIEKQKDNLENFNSSKSQHQKNKRIL